MRADDVRAECGDITNRKHERLPKTLAPLGRSPRREVEKSEFGKGEKEPVLRFDEDGLRPCRIVQIEQRSSGRRRYPYQIALCESGHV